MPSYLYKAKNDAGKLFSDLLDAESRYEALIALRRKGLTVVELQETSGSEKQTGRVAQQGKKRFGLFRAVHISLLERTIFCRQLAISVASGLSLPETLEAIGEDTSKPKFRNVIGQILESVRSGTAFSSALARHPTLFDILFTTLIRTAEESGSLSAVLNYLSSLLERRERIWRKIRAVSVYPIFLAVVAIIVSLIMTVFVLPRFQVFM